MQNCHFLRTNRLVHMILCISILLLIAARDASALDCEPTYPGLGQPGSKFGFAVGRAGHIDADSLSDFIIGEPWFLDTLGAPVTGRALVRGRTNDKIWEFRGEANGDLFGYSVSGGADVNNDGVEDIIVGAPGHKSNPLFEEGAVYVFSGSDGALLYRITGVNVFDSLGYSVAMIGDLNGDLYADFIVGAPGWDNGGDPETGRAYVFLGSSIAATQYVDANVADYVIQGDTAGAQLGWSVASAGDVTGDGNDDIVVGLPGRDVNTGQARVYAHTGSSLALLTTLVGDSLGERFGHAVAGLGDINGDCLSDIAVGAPHYGTTLLPTNSGRVAVYLANTTTPFMQIVSHVAGDSLGFSVAAAGDRNYDDLMDVMIGSPGSSSASYTSNGNAYIYYGRSSSPVGDLSPADADVTIAGNQNNGHVGWSVAGVGSVDEDPADDQLVGEPGYLDASGRVRLNFCYDPPPPPRNVTVSDAGDSQSVIFTWDPPTGASANVSKYQVVLVDSSVDIHTECLEFLREVEVGSGTTKTGFKGLERHVPVNGYVRALYDDSSKSDFEPTPGDSSVYPTTPIFLVHGLNSNRDRWDTYIDWLAGAGYRRTYAMNLYKWGKPHEEDFDGNASELSNYIESVLKDLDSTGQDVIEGFFVPEFDIIAHSMGGLVSRRYIAEEKQDWGMVRKSRKAHFLFTMASPHGGTFTGDRVLILYNRFPVLGDWAKEYMPAPAELSTTKMLSFNDDYSDNNGVHICAAYGKGGRTDYLCHPKYNSSCPGALRITTYSETCPNDGVVPSWNIRLVNAEAVLAVDAACHDAITDVPFQYVFDEWVLSALNSRIPPVSAFKPADPSIDSIPPQVIYETYDSVYPGASDSLIVPVTEYGNLVIWISSPNSDLSIKLKSPTGYTWDEAATLADPFAVYESDTLTRGYVLPLAAGTDADIGEWIVHFINVDGTDYYCLQAIIAPDSTTDSACTIEFITSIQPSDPYVLDTLTLEATVQTLLGDPPNSALVEVVPMFYSDTGLITRTVVTLVDDGTNGDITPNDGVYTGLFADYVDAGLYTFDFVADGITLCGNSFSRQATMSVNARPRPITCQTFTNSCMILHYLWPVPGTTVARTRMAEGFDPDTAFATRLCSVKSVSVFLYDWVDPAQQVDVDVSIHGDDGSGLPGAKLATYTIPAATVNAGLGSFLTVDLSPYNVVIPPGERFHVVIDAPTATPGLSGMVLASDAGSADSLNCPEGAYNTRGSVFYSDVGFWESHAAHFGGSQFGTLITVDVCYATSCPIDVPGDVNLSGNVTSADIIAMVGYVFKGGAEPLPCAANGDINCSGNITSADIIGMVNYVFKGGAPPCDICNDPNAALCEPAGGYRLGRNDGPLPVVRQAHRKIIERIRR